MNTARINAKNLYNEMTWAEQDQIKSAIAKYGKQFVMDKMMNFNSPHHDNFLDKMRDYNNTMTVKIMNEMTGMNVRYECPVYTLW